MTTPPPPIPTADMVASLPQLQREVLALLPIGYWRGACTCAELARDIGVVQRAAQKAVRRLCGLGLVESSERMPGLPHWIIRAEAGDAVRCGLG